MTETARASRSGPPPTAAPHAVWCADQKPRCPGWPPHRIRTAHRITTDGILTCAHQFGPGQRCGKRLFVSLLYAGTRERLWYIVEIDGERERALRERPMTFLEKLHLLGHTAPGVEFDFWPDDDPDGAAG